MSYCCFKYRIGLLGFLKIICIENGFLNIVIHLLLNFIQESIIEDIKIKPRLNFVRAKYEDDEGVYIIIARH